MRRTRLAPWLIPLFASFVSCSSESGGGDVNVEDGAVDTSLADGSIPVPDGAIDVSTDDTNKPIDDSTAEVVAESGSETAPPDTAVPPTGTLYAYVGLGGGDIVQLSFDGASGALAEIGRTKAGSNPSFLAFDATRTHLYAVNEGSSEVAAFSIAKGTGALTFLNRVSSSGNGPAYVGVDTTSRFAMIANYGGGNVAILPILADGKLGTAVDTEASGANAHSIRQDPSGKFVYVPSKGADTISQYAFDSTSGALTALTPAKVATAKGAGPRHFDFHPSGKWAYLINENDDTVVALSHDGKGLLTSMQTLSSLPTGSPGGSNTCADLHVSPSGKFLYGSNRGHNSIVIYSIDGTTGRLTLVGHEPTGGNTPRNFGITESGAYLLAANQGSGTIVVFKIDATAGTLSKLGTTTVGGSPAFVSVVSIPK